MKKSNQISIDDAIETDRVKLKFFLDIGSALAIIALVVTAFAVGFYVGSH